MAVEEQAQENNTWRLYSGSHVRAGQKLTIPNRNITKLGFWLHRSGSPTGDVYFRIRKVSNDSVMLEKVVMAAGDVPAETTYCEVEFDSPAIIDEEVRLSVEWGGGNYSHCIQYHFQGSDVKASEYAFFYDSSYTEVSNYDGAYRYTYLPLAPTVTIQPMTDILAPSAKAHGTVTVLGATPCTQHGHCWSTSPDPTTEDDKTELGAVASAPHVFESTLTGLLEDTTYHVRAYATDESGAAYSDEISFTTTWRDEKVLPFTPTGQIFFSPIIDNEVYVIDQGSNFYKYNLTTRTWSSALAAPNYGSTSASRSRFFRTLAISPDGTKLACCSEGVFCTAGGVDKNTGGGRRVEIYNISANTWAASKQTDFLIAELIAYTRSLVWEDDDTLWVWCIRSYRTSSGWSIKCVKYVLSTDTWTAYTGSFQDTANYGDGLNCGNGGCAIKADKSVVYSGGTALSTYTCKKYTIAADTYSGITLVPFTNHFCHIYDRDKIWYYEAGGTYQQGYIDVEDDSKHDDIYSENPDLDTSGKHGGIADDLSFIIIHAKSAAPELMSLLLVLAPTVTTQEVSDIVATTATGNGNITDNGGEDCDERGIVYDTSSHSDPGNTAPAASDYASYEEETGSFGTGAFTRSLTGLSPGQTYYARAYARNPAGYSYGDEVEFTTVAALTVTTDPATSVGQTTATLNGTLDGDGGEACDCSFEYGETEEYGSTTPTQSKTTGETFSQEVRGLKGGSVYHFRAVATNSAETSYGVDRTFHTEALSAEAHQALGRHYSMGRHGL